MKRHDRFRFRKRLGIGRVAGTVGQALADLDHHLGQVYSLITEFGQVSQGLEHLTSGFHAAVDQVPPDTDTYWRTFDIARSTRALATRLSLGLASMNASKSRTAVG